MTRISSLNLFTTGLNELQRRQGDLSRTQEQLTSGKRVLRASDDPTAAARAERALATVARADANQRALESSRNSMVLAEAALGDANSLVQDAREALVNAGNPTFTAAERDVLANRLRDLRAQLLNVANRTDGAGGFLFSGQGARTAPFVDGPSGVGYAGQSGDQVVASETAMPVTVDGQLTWKSARTGNGVFTTLPGTPASTSAWIDTGQVANPTALTGADYRITVTGGSAVVDRLDAAGAVAATSTLAFTPGKALSIDGMSFTIHGQPQPGDTFRIEPSEPSLSVFDALDSAIAGLKTTTLTDAQRSQVVSTGLRDLDASLTLLQGSRARVGALLTGIDQTESRIADLKLYGQKERSAAEDMDMTAAVSDFQNQQTGYDAALRSYAMVQRMSLFDYISGG